MAHSMVEWPSHSVSGVAARKLPHPLLWVSHAEGTGGAGPLGIGCTIAAAQYSVFSARRAKNRAFRTQCWRCEDLFLWKSVWTKTRPPPPTRVNATNVYQRILEHSMRHHETIDLPAAPPFRAFALLGAWIFITSSARRRRCMSPSDAESLALEQPRSARQASPSKPTLIDAGSLHLPFVLAFRVRRHGVAAKIGSCGGGRGHAE